MKKKEELNLTGNLTLEDIEKIRKDNDKKIKNMSFEELNKHFANAEKDFYKDVEKYEEKLKKKEDKNSEIVSDEIILYYKSIPKDNYIELINSDLKKSSNLENLFRVDVVYSHSPNPPHDWGEFS